MRTLLLVKYRDEPFAKMCTRYPFAATVEKNNMRDNTCYKNALEYILPVPEKSHTKQKQSIFLRYSG
jgi:hypothetical protein